LLWKIVVLTFQQEIHVISLTKRFWYLQYSDIADQLERQILVTAAEQTDNFLVSKKIVLDDNACRREVLPNGVKIDGTAQLTYPDFIKDKDVIIYKVHKFLSKKPSQEDLRWWVEELPDDLFKIVIMDKANHFFAPSWKRIIDKFRGHALVVFLTATRFRSDKKEIIEDVKDAVVFHLSLAQARDTRVIRRTTKTVVNTAGYTDEQIFRAVLAKVKQIQDDKNRDQPLPGGVPHLAIAITKTKELANLAAETWNNFCDNGTAFAYYTDVPNELPQLPEIMNGIKRNQVIKGRVSRLSACASDDLSAVKRIVFRPIRSAFTTLAGYGGKLL